MIKFFNNVLIYFIISSCFYNNIFLEAIPIYSFTILQCFFEKETKSICDRFFSKDKYNIKIYTYDSFDTNPKFQQINFLIEQIHLFMFYLDKNPYYIIEFIKKIQSHSKYSNYPMILFSQSREYLVEAFFQLKPFQSVLLPISKKTSNDFIKYIDFYYNMYKTSYKKILELNYPSCSYRFQIDDILFAEAKNRKVSICTKDNSSTELPITFQHFLELIPDNTLIQSHRCYIINPCNVSRIDKNSNNWTASFYNTDKKASISRSYRQSTLNVVFAYMYKENSIQIENYPMIDMYYFQ